MIASIIKSTSLNEQKLQAAMDDLRIRAENLITPDINHDYSKLSSAEIAGMVHELETYQLELEMQNRELFLTQQILVDSRDEFTRLYESAPVGYLSTDKKDHILQSNMTLAHMLDTTTAKMSHNLLTDFIEDDDQDTYHKHRVQLLESRQKQSCELRLKTRGGKPLWVRLDSVCWPRPNSDEYLQIRSAVIDITERRIAEAEHYKLLQAVEVSPLAVYITDNMGNIEYSNPKFSEITGYSRQEVQGKNIRILQSGSTPPFVYEKLWETITSGNNWFGKIYNKTKNGTYYWASNSISSIKDARGIISHFVAIQNDVTRESELSEKLSYQACHDNLTGLINRYEFERRIEKVIKSINDNTVEHVVCFMDLDQFKVINDSCGHMAGDQLLRQLGKTLQKKIRLNDTLARLGGDEFGLLLQDCSMEQARKISHTILQAVQNLNFKWENRVYNIGISIGLATLNGGSSLKEVLMQADAACYQAKDLGRNRIEVYHSENNEMTTRRGEMQSVAYINQALKENRFHLQTQSIESAHDHNMNHVEVLIRMVNEAGEELLPEKFIPAAEHYNLIQRIDIWTIKEVFALLEKHPHFRDEISILSINLSGASISSKTFLAELHAIIQTSSVDPQKICFEITETAAISNFSRAKEFISSLKKLGCYFALDDFGSGLSSFGYLKQLPVDFLKIDGIFVKGIANSEFDFAVVKSINEIGHALGMKTIAEYVIDHKVRSIVQSLGVDFMQGNGISRPRPIEDLIEHFEKKASDNRSE